MDEPERRAVYRSAFVLNDFGARALADLEQTILNDCGPGAMLEPLAGLAFANRYSVVRYIKEMLDDG